MKLISRYLITITIVASPIVYCCENTFQTKQAQNSAQPAYKDYELFKIVMKIRELTNKTIDEFQGYDLDLEKGSMCFPDAFPCENRTKQGLYAISTWGPYKLVTPWGGVMLTGSGNGYGNLFVAFSQVLLKKLHAKFVYAASRDTDKTAWYVLRPNVDLLQPAIREPKRLLDSHFDLLSEEELNKNIGQEIFATPSFNGEAIYAITEFDGKPMPEVLRSSRDCALDEQIHKAWLEHKDRYIREQKS